MNKTILVTGAAKRIGKEIALTFAAEGWNIIIHCHSSTADAEKLAAEINTNRENQAKVVQANLDKDDHVARLIEDTKSCYGRLDAIVNNASAFYPTPIGSLTQEDWDQLIGSNLKGPLFLINGLIDLLKESKGVVINMTDMNVDRGLSKYAIYTAAKGGLLAVTKVLARELAPIIRVNAVAPGAILEPPNTSWSDEVRNRILANIPLGRLGTEKDIAGAVKFLVDSPYITGEVINVDGGRSLS